MTHPIPRLQESCNADQELIEGPSCKSRLSTSSFSAHPKSSSKRTFPKSARLLTSPQYRFMYRNSSRYLGEAILIDFRRGKSLKAKLGITVSKKFGKAHDRNRFKRVVREAFRQLYPLLPQGLEVVVSPRQKGCWLTTQTIMREFQSMLVQEK